jgi:hypothetical protein
LDTNVCDDTSSSLLHFHTAPPLPLPPEEDDDEEEDGDPLPRPTPPPPGRRWSPAGLWGRSGSIRAATRDASTPKDEEDAGAGAGLEARSEAASWRARAAAVRSEAGSEASMPADEAAARAAKPTEDEDAESRELKALPDDVPSGGAYAEKVEGAAEEEKGGGASAEVPAAAAAEEDEEDRRSDASFRAADSAVACTGAVAAGVATGSAGSWSMRRRIDEGRCADSRPRVGDEDEAEWRDDEEDEEDEEEDADSADAEPDRTDASAAAIDRTAASNSATRAASTAASPARAASGRPVAEADETAAARAEPRPLPLPPPLPPLLAPREGSRSVPCIGSPAGRTKRTASRTGDGERVRVVGATAWGRRDALVRSASRSS